MAKPHCLKARSESIDTLLIAAFLLVVLLALLASGVWVSLSLLGAGFIGITFFTGSSVSQAGQVLASTVWGASNSWALAALPLFIWMGEILFRSKLSADMFKGLAPWLSWLPGRLLHVNIIGCGIFAAVSGSSAATAATIGKMAIPELQKRNYDMSSVVGSLAGSGTLGLLIPPSIILIVYGVATDQSIARLFVAGILPGVLLVFLFMGYVIVWSLLNSDKVPQDDIRMSFMDRVRGTKSLLPVVVLIGGVIGSIYSGIASPTDAAAVGVALALFLSWLGGNLTWETFRDGLIGATRTSCMIALILAGAAFLTVAMAFTQIPGLLAEWIGDMGLSPYALLAVLTVFFVLLGCFLDGISVVVLTTSVILPMVEKVGIDTLWFGIFIVIVVEMSQITPPVGFNLFVLQSLTGRTILEVAKSAMPFFLLMLVALALIVFVPEIVTCLPGRMGR